MSIIQADALTFRWKGQRQNLLEIDRFSISKGERIFLRGPSGSGKSSFLSLLAAINTPCSGSLEILGHRVHRLKPGELDELRADHIGYIFQLFNLVPYLSVLENVTLPCLFSKIRRQRVESSGERVESQAKRLLGKLGLSGDVLDTSVVELSVGQQQRVAACRALIGTPEIIIADEPTSALDADAQKAFIDLLAEECALNGITLIFVSHDTRFSSLFDRTASLENGRILFDTIPMNERLA